METKTHTFVKGLNTDTAIASLDGASYKLAKNFELSSSKDGEVGALASIRGNTEVVTPHDIQDLAQSNIVGYVNLKDKVVIFEAIEGRNTIWLYTPGEGLSVVLSDQNLQAGESLGFYEGLRDDPNYKVTAVSSYESETSQKIYWTDGVNPMRHLNIAKRELSIRLENLNIIPIGTYNCIKSTEIITGGKINSGKRQYSYRTVNKFGAISSFSSPTELLSITKESPSDYSTYYGTDRDLSSGKAVKVTFTDLDGSFDIIQLYSIHYNEYSSVPIIHLIAEQNIPEASTSDIVIIDSGNVLSEISLVEFNAGAGRIFSANSLEVKDSILFAGGIKEYYEDLSIDCRAFSFNKEVVSNDIVLGTFSPVSTSLPFSSLTFSQLPTTQFLTFNYVPGTRGDFSTNTTSILKPTGTFYGTDYLKGAIRVEIKRTYTTPYVPITNMNVVLTFNTPTGTRKYTGSAVFPNHHGSSTATVSFNILETINSIDSLGVGIHMLGSSSQVGINFESNLFIENLRVVTAMEGNCYSKVVNTNGETENIFWGGESNFSLPEDADCINPYTDVYTYNEKEYHGTEEAFKYQSDGVTLGGTGKLVSYKFVDYHIPESYVGSGVTYGNSYSLGHDGISMPINEKTTTLINTYPGFKRGEVYRCGVQFFDKLGKPLFVSWIADIRIPYTLEWDGVPNSRYVKSKVFSSGGTSTASTYACPIKIEFTFNFGGLPSDVRNKLSGFRMVRAKREVHDRSVLMQGLATMSTPHTGSNNVYYPYLEINTGGWLGGKNIWVLHSPDYFANKARLDIPSSKIHIVGYSIASQAVEIGTSSKIYRFSRAYPHYNYEEEATMFPYNSIFNTIEILESEHLGYKEPLNTVGHVIDNILYSNSPVDSASNDPNYLYGATSIALLITQPSGVMNNVNGFPIIDIVVDNIHSRYGGNSYYSRQNSEYIGMSPFFYIKTSPISVKAYGDTYTTMYSQMIGYSTSGDNAVKKQYAISFPVESVINCMMFKDKPGPLMDKFPANAINKWGIQETKEEGISMFPQDYPGGIGNLYSYNSVFSQQSVFPTYRPRPFLFEEEGNNNSMIIASERKLGKELIDPWTKFLYSNVMELSAKNGSIMELKNINSKLFCWQENAVSIISSNDRYIINENNQGQLALGAGGILERYDYVTENSGVQHKYAVTPVANSVVWIDANKKKIMSFSEELEDLTVSKGINKYVSNVGGIESPFASYNTSTNKVHFRLKDNNILSYNVELQVFEGVLTSNVLWEIPLTDGTMLESNGPLSLWESNSNEESGSYFGTSNSSVLEFVTSDNYLYTKVFDTIEWDANIINTLTGLSSYDFPDSTIQVYNDYQNSSEITLDWRRSERTFRAAIPRDAVVGEEISDKDIFNPINLDVNSKFRRRIIGKHSVIRLEVQEGNHRVIIPYINVNYRISHR